MQALMAKEQYIDAGADGGAGARLLASKPTTAMTWLWTPGLL